MATIPFLQHCTQRFGGMFTLSMWGLGSSVWVTDPAVIKDLYTRDRENLVPAGTGTAIEPMFGLRSVLLADGPTHRRKRRLLTPPLHGDRIAVWRERMIGAAEREINTWPVGHEFALAPRMAAVTQEVIFEVVFGLGEGERARQLRAALAEMVQASMRTAGVLLGFFRSTSRFRRAPLTPWGSLQRKADRTRALLEEEIRHRRADQDLADRDDIFSVLLRATDDTGQAMDDEELRDELMSLLLAGAESSATTLAWAFDFLLHHEDALDRLCSELDQSDERYLEAVLQETMRLVPVPHVTARQLATPMQACGYALPAGATVTVPAYVVHRRADVYADPEAFRPERFLNKAPSAFSWVPFGGGVRRCVGASFAMLEMKCVISTVLQRVRLRPASAKAERIRMRNIILTPARGTRVVVVNTKAPSALARK